MFLGSISRVLFGSQRIAVRLQGFYTTSRLSTFQHAPGDESIEGEEEHDVHHQRHIRKPRSKKSSDQTSDKEQEIETETQGDVDFNEEIDDEGFGDGKCDYDDDDVDDDDGGAEDFGASQQEDDDLVDMDELEDDGQSATSLQRADVNVGKQKIVLNPDDLEEQFVRGSGNGGQKINKTNNCVLLKHVPTGIQVKCQQTRSLQLNRSIARKRLIEKLDVHINKDLSKKTQKGLRRKKNQQRRHLRAKKKAQERKLDQQQQQQQQQPEESKETS